jgi:hypothetical protein
MTATTAKVAAAVAGGYLLGRTKKLKLAVTLAGLLAGRKLAADPKAIVGKIVDGNPELEHLRGQLSDGLTGAAKELAMATAASRLESMTDAIQGASEDTDSDQEDEFDEPEDEAGEPEDEADEQDEDSGTTKKAASKKSSAAKKSSSARKSSAAKKSGPAKKATSRRKSSSKKAASSAGGR